MTRLLRHLCCAVGTLLVALVSCRAAPASDDFQGYAEPDGAITVQLHGDHVDPYFATQSLLIAIHGGLDVRTVTHRWIEWMIARQEATGLFSRFCRAPDGWTRCQRADADDALLALWLELLYEMSPDDGLPQVWRASADMAQSRLDSLLDRKRGIYLIAHDNPVGLFMDNVEIYAALRAIGGAFKRMGDGAQSRAYEKRAQQLRRAIERVFHSKPRQPYAVSTQPSAEERFYPEVVAQIYPVFFRMPMPQTTLQAAMRSWLDTYRADWLGLQKDHYPWGLVALAAMATGECPAAVQWAERAEPLRHGARWNVMEEVSLVLVRRFAAPAGASCQERATP